MDSIQSQLSDFRKKISESDPNGVTSVAIRQTEFAMLGITSAALADQQRILDDVRSGRNPGDASFKIPQNGGEVTRVPYSWVPGRTLVVSFRGAQVCYTNTSIMVP